ncbi:MAG: alcohol dehydrogenase catalytic domain-containing protein [Nitrososphaerota archaeon]|nr:alcohol dehydrogenase catalytic domain-containing protein [Aigarchaeota archaeon]MDW8076966.1 alcohol dehydrogenase catalytic domain-containing protein [Nitrososphaerota archaeon]
MKAALLHKTAPVEKDPLVVEDVPVPEPKDDQVLVKVEACGVCRSNLHMIEGDWVEYGLPSKYPIIPGHEIVGTIREIGRSVEGLGIGQRVGIQPLWSACGTCEYCLRGLEHLCPRKKIAGETVDGGYAEYILADYRYVYPMPANLDPVEAAPLFCPGVTAYGAVLKAEIKPGKKVAVFGIGGVGHMVVQIAKLYGAEVIAVSRSKEHLKVAEELGADLIIDSSTSDPVDEIRKLGGVDASIVFAPSNIVAEQALKVTKPSGTIVIGVHVKLGEFFFHEEKKIVGSVIGSRWMMKEVIELARSGKIRSICEKYPLEKVNEVLKKLKRGEIRARAVLIP